MKKKFIFNHRFSVPCLNLWAWFVFDEFVVIYYFWALSYFVSIVCFGVCLVILFVILVDFVEERCIEEKD